MISCPIQQLPPDLGLVSLSRVMLLFTDGETIHTLVLPGPVVCDGQLKDTGVLRLQGRLKHGRLHGLGASQLSLLES